MQKQDSQTRPYRRSWRARAHQVPNGFTNVYIDLPDDMVRLAGAEAHVTVAEDPAGEYMGWFDAGKEDMPPAMIQRAAIFGIQFPYGVQAEVDRGRGSVIHLSVTARDA